MTLLCSVELLSTVPNSDGLQPSSDGLNDRAMALPCFSDLAQLQILVIFDVTHWPSWADRCLVKMQYARWGP